MITSKELMHLEDFLNLGQLNGKTFQHLASEAQDPQAKQMFQQISQKQQQHVQTISKHLSGAQNLQ